MYDTVKTILYSNQANDTDFLQETTCFLDNVIPCSYGGLEYAKAYLKGLTLKLTPDCLLIDKGSFCKFLLGDNYKTLRICDVKRGFEELSDILRLPMKDSKLLRFDAGCNITLKHIPEVYFKYLGDLSRYKRSTIKKGTLYYLQDKSALCLYDKNLEHRKHGESIPDDFKDKNVLRAEMRILKSPGKVLQMEQVTAEYLYDEVFYVMIKQRFARLFNSIKKINSKILNFENIGSFKDLKEYGAIVLIDQMGGPLAVLQQVKIAQEKNDITASQACRFRKEVYKLYSNRPEIIEHSNEIEELDSKMKTAIELL